MAKRWLSSIVSVTEGDWIGPTPGMQTKRHPVRLQVVGKRASCGSCPSRLLASRQHPRNRNERECVCVCEESEGKLCVKAETQTQTQTQTDRQTQTDTDRQTDTHTDQQRGYALILQPQATAQRAGWLLSSSGCGAHNLATASAQAHQTQHQHESFQPFQFP